MLVPKKWRFEILIHKSQVQKISSKNDAKKCSLLPFRSSRTFNSLGTKAQRDFLPKRKNQIPCFGLNKVAASDAAGSKIQALLKRVVKIILLTLN